MQISTGLQKLTPSMFSCPEVLGMNGRDAAHALDWHSEAGPTVTALGGEHGGCWRT